MANMESYPGLLTEGNEYKYDLRWLVERLLSFENDLKTAIDLQTIVYADPIEWDITSQYTRNMVVLDGNIAYLSKQPVPKGIDIANADYWQSIFDLTDILSSLTTEQMLPMITPYIYDGKTSIGKYLAIGDLFWKNKKSKWILCQATAGAVSLTSPPTHNELTSLNGMLGSYGKFVGNHVLINFSNSSEVDYTGALYLRGSLTDGVSGGTLAGRIPTMNMDVGQVTLNPTNYGNITSTVPYLRITQPINYREKGGSTFIKQFPTLSALVTATRVYEGDVVQTLGYNQALDDGGLLYKLLQENDSSRNDLVRLTGSNLYAYPIYEQTMSPYQFGYTNDLSSIFTKMSKVECIDLQGKTYYLTDTAVISADAATRELCNGVIKMSGAVNTALLNIAKKNFTIRNVIFDCPNSFSTSGHYRSMISLASGATVEGCAFTGLHTATATVDSDGFLEVTGENNRIHSCVFRDVANEFTNVNNILIRCINATGSAMIDSCEFDNCSQGIASSTNVTVRNCSFKDIKDNGVYFFGDSEIYDSTFTKCEEAVVASANITLQGCTFIDNTNTSVSLGGDGNNDIRMIDCQSIRAKNGAADRQFLIRSDGSIHSFTAINCNFTENAESNGTGLFQFGASVRYTTFIGCFFRTRLNGWSTFLVYAGNTVEFYNCTGISTNAGSLCAGSTVTVGGGWFLNCRHGQATIRNIPTVQANIDAALGNAYIIATNAKPTATTGIEAGSLAINSGSTNVVGWRFNGTEWVDIT